jgi:DNA-binding transcriptional ArsR family regulator
LSISEADVLPPLPYSPKNEPRIDPIPEPNSMASSTPTQLTSLEALGQAAECLKVLAHPHRLRMLQMLKSQQVTVTQLAEACQIPTPMASEHLRLMQRCGFLSSRREGRKVFYQIIEPHLKNILQCIEDRFGEKPNPSHSSGLVT